jgi:hypothetical protein
MTRDSVIPNLAPGLFTNTLSIRIQTYIQVGPINQWHKSFEHRVNSCGMEKPLNGSCDCPHIVGCLTCAKSTSATDCVVNRRCHHKPDFKLAPGQKQVVSQNVENGHPRKSDVPDTQFVFGSCHDFQRIGACGDDMERHAWHSAHAIVQIY